MGTERKAICKRPLTILIREIKVQYETSTDMVGLADPRKTLRLAAPTGPHQRQG